MSQKNSQQKPRENVDAERAFKTRDFNKELPCALALTLTCIIVSKCTTYRRLPAVNLKTQYNKFLKRQMSLKDDHVVNLLKHAHRDFGNVNLYSVANPRAKTFLNSHLIDVSPLRYALSMVLLLLLL